jgi:hypothetical protein
MLLGEKTRLRARATLPLALAFLVFASACDSDDSSTGGTGGAGGTGGSGGATGGSAGSGGATGGSAGSGGATGGSAGSGGATGGSAGSGGATGGSAGSGGATGGSAGAGGATGGSAGTGGATGGSAGAGGATGGSAGSAGAGGTTIGDAGVADPRMNFFVTSDTSKTGNLGGLTGADERCQRLAMAAGHGSKTWRAYLSTEAGDAGAAVHAKDRIGPGPYINSKGATLAADSAALHARSGDADLFIDEKGQKINGQWMGSPTPIDHDVLTGSMPDGTVMAGMTCINWTSADMSLMAQVGHSDGLGPGGDGAPPRNSWNSAHANGGCHDTTPRGGAGRLYCFVGP